MESGIEIVKKVIIIFTARMLYCLLHELGEYNIMWIPNKVVYRVEKIQRYDSLTKIHVI